MSTTVSIGRIVLDGPLRDRRAFAAALEDAIRVGLGGAPAPGDARPEAARDAIAGAVVRAVRERTP